MHFAVTELNSFDRGALGRYVVDSSAAQYTCCSVKTSVYHTNKINTQMYKVNYRDGNYCSENRMAWRYYTENLYSFA